MRKLERILAGFVSSPNPDADRLSMHHVLSAVARHEETSAELADLARSLSAAIPENALDAVMRDANALRYAIRREMGIETGDWDLLPRAPEADRGTRAVLPHRLYLEDIRSPFNVGAIFRAAESFGIAEILVSPDCAPPNHPRARRSAMGTDAIVPWRVCSLEELGGEAVFLLETGGTSVEEFAFPARGVMIVGSEELGVSAEARQAASAGIVTIETGGVKGSLNVAVAVGIAVQRWFVRR